MKTDPPPRIHTDDIRPDPNGPFPVDIPFVRHLGLQLLEFGEGRATVRIDPGAEHQNTFGMAHGGVIMTMMDICMLMAGRAAGREDDDQTQGLITIELKTSFMKPAVGIIRAHGVCVHRTASMAFCEAELRNESNDVLSKATGTFKYMKQRRAR